MYVLTMWVQRSSLGSYDEERGTPCIGDEAVESVQAILMFVCQPST